MPDGDENENEQQDDDVQRVDGSGRPVPEVEEAVSPKTGHTNQPA